MAISASLACRLLLGDRDHIKSQGAVMSVVHEARPALSAEPRARQRALLGRLMIVCPATGHSADTGFELSAVPMASARQQILVDCLECGQDHRWRIEDAFLD